MAEESQPDQPQNGGDGGLTRRAVIIGGGVAVAGAAAAGIVIATSDDDEEGAEGYPRKRIAGTGELRPGKPVSFAYPLENQAGLLLDLGEEAPGGVGDSGGIVAYSI